MFLDIEAIFIREKPCVKVDGIGRRRACDMYMAPREGVGIENGQAEILAWLLAGFMARKASFTG